MEESKKRKRALVTGGSGGIGSAAVRQLAARGIETVFLYHRGTEAAAALTAETGIEGDPAGYFRRRRGRAGAVRRK